MYNENISSVNTGGIKMKRYVRGLTAIIISASFVGGVASAQEANCDITGTGPGSENTCEIDEKNIIHVTCKNNVYVVNDNDQDSESGDGTVHGNNSGGSASSGSAVNENGTEVEIGASCGAQEVVTPSNPEAPVTGIAAVTPSGGAGGVGGGGGGAGVAMLPDTAGNNNAGIAAISITALVSVIVASRFGLLAYQRAALK